MVMAQYLFPEHDSRNVRTDAASSERDDAGRSLAATREAAVLRVHSLAVDVADVHPSRVDRDAVLEQRVARGRIRIGPRGLARDPVAHHRVEVARDPLPLAEGLEVGRAEAGAPVVTGRDVVRGGLARLEHAERARGVCDHLPAEDHDDVLPRGLDPGRAHFRCRGLDRVSRHALALGRCLKLTYQRWTLPYAGSISAPAKAAKSRAASRVQSAMLGESPATNFRVASCPSSTLRAAFSRVRAFSAASGDCFTRCAKNGLVFWKMVPTLV